MEIQLRKHGTNHFCFVSDEVTETHRVANADQTTAKRRLNFKAEFVRHRGGENIPDREETIPAEEFSAWWQRMFSEKWRICPEL